MRQMAVLGVLAVAGALAVEDGRAQDQAPRPPAATFRSAVDLVPVDVNVIDRNGRPIADLTAGDFVLTVDGRPRTIVSAEYVAAARESAPSRPQPVHYSTNTASAGGRLLMLVVDQGNIGAGRGKLALDAASRFLERLHPSDRVGLVAIPAAGTQIDFTSNHAVVRSMLPKLVGTATPIMTSYRIGLSEAVQIDGGDPRALEQLLARECAGVREPAEIEMCNRQLTADAQQLAQVARERARNSLVSLRHLVERLAATPAPKTIVLISEGLVIDRDDGELAWLGPAAARGQVVLYVLQLDQPTFEASSGRPSPTRAEDVYLAREGLSRLAELARGTVMRVAGNADPAFARLSSELSGYYLLGFEPEAADRDGKPHRIHIQVPGRTNVDIRARGEFVIETGAAMTDEAVLAATLKTPLLAGEIGLELSAYTLGDPESGKLRVVLAAEIDRSQHPTGPLSVAYMLVDAQGRLIGSRIDPAVQAPVRPTTRSQLYVGAMLADAPGIHTAKLAVIDERGKRGSVEHTFRAQLVPAGQIRATDLLIAENTGTTDVGVLPAVAGEFSTDTLHGYLELYSDAPEILRDASVTFEVADGETARALDSGVGRSPSASAAARNRRIVEGSVTIGLLPPGDYVARAVIEIRGRKAGQVVRPFRITRAAPSITAPGVSRMAGPARPAIPFTSRIDDFDRQAVLAPPVLGFFLDRMSAAPGADPATLPAFGHARAGRFDALTDALKGAGSDQVAPAFLHGLALYARGDLEGAAGRFREALRLDSEFFPAVFYLGSCYAAGGRDREAVGAWKTSLVTESDAPFIYTLLGDAMLRLRDLESAIDILTEASTLWPSNDDVLMRLGTAQVMAGRHEEGLQTLEGYLARHPSDADRHFLALRALYETRAAGRSIKSPEADRALFNRYAGAYATANGTQQALVEQWRRFMRN
ncbi:MAG TPA: VWA domain-containing protein [Vicinamibacterales bacterium]|nr:VWA domain-containing protein [Vicinamibacterales bacterium]